MHPKPSSLKMAMSRIAVILTVLFWCAYVTSVIARELIDGQKSYQFTMEVIGYVVIVTLLTFSALMYLVARQGAFQRFAQHARTPRALIDKFFAAKKPSITVLIPSYDEEPEVIRKTVLSAALQEYAKMRVVLLIDDNPYPSSQAKLDKLNATRALAEDINTVLARPHARFARALKSFEKAKANSTHATKATVTRLANHYSWAATWLTDMAEAENIHDHVDAFFAKQVLVDLADDLRLVSKALEASNESNERLTIERVHQLYRRLVWIFGTKVETFERKRYYSLSHEPNKAMNLNAYISLMGGKYKKVETIEGDILVKTDKTRQSDLIIPDSDYILTLDADSILLKDYCLRLVHFLEQPANADVAVTQTPYSSFRGAGSRIERLSGATTDIQHILHQGMTHYNATFWVGANAVIRKSALEDIKESSWVNGFEIARYVQDNTVIEDTESSIDLAIKNWRLVNYPERLSYSATPPDFGSLIVQRRRWANGGLLIMPKLWANMRALKKRNESVDKVEFLLRLNYMTSIAWSNIGLVFLLAYPYDGRLLSPLVLLAATPYFIAMASDLKYSRYKYSDIFRIYGFNLILLPVNLAGVFKSIQQGLTGRKLPFARTPKVKDRTSAALSYVVAPLLIIGFSLFTLWRNVLGENWGNALFAGFNAIAATWALVSYIGIWNMIADIWVGLTDWMFVEVPTAKAAPKPVASATFDWKSILYHGEIPENRTHIAIKDMVVAVGE